VTHPLKIADSAIFYRFAIRSWSSVVRSLFYSWATCFAYSHRMWETRLYIISSLQHLLSLQRCVIIRGICQVYCT